MEITGFSLYDAICRNASLQPDKQTIIFGTVRLSNGEFKDACERLAAGLLSTGVEKGDRVAVIGHNCSNYLAVYGAAAKTGAIAVPINWRAQPEELEHILGDCTPKLVFAGTEYLEPTAAALKKTNFGARIYSLGEGAAGHPSFEEACAGGFTGRFPEIDPRADYVIMYTAAVGGRPQGAVLSQANIIATGVQLADLYGLGANDCNICFIPLFHIGGLAMCAAVMLKGGRNVLMDRFDPAEALALIEKERVSVFFSFSPMLKMLCENVKNHDLASIRKISGIESPEHIEAFGKCAGNAVFFSTYGQTECMPVSGGRRELSPTSAGRPALLTRVALCDDYDNEVPRGTAGEICVRSPAVFRGYWNNEEGSAWTLRNGWHHTGDVGRFDEDGFLYYVKRKAHKQLIKTGGENVYPAEVEKAILAHASVSAAAVFGIPDRDWGEAVAAMVILKPDMALEKNELLEFLGGRIAGFKKPRHVAFAISLPRTADGEVDREKLKEIFTEE